VFKSSLITKNYTQFIAVIVSQLNPSRVAKP